MESRSMYSPSRTCPNPGPMSPREPPACVQNAMMKERKPFTYTPGGLDLSEIKSEKMARRLMMNALSPGVQEKPKPPSFTPETPPATVRPPPLHNFNMPVPVFPRIVIPPNPKELLRKTSGPYNRSESVENREFSPQKQAENGTNNDTNAPPPPKPPSPVQPEPMPKKDDEEVRKVPEETPKETQNITIVEKPIQNNEEIPAPLLLTKTLIPGAVQLADEPSEEDSSDEEEDLPIDEKPYQPESDSDSSSSSGSDSEYVQLDYSVTNAMEKIKLDQSTCDDVKPDEENIEIEKEPEDDAVLEVKQEVEEACQPEANVTVINEDENKLMESEKPTDIIEDANVNETININDVEEINKPEEKLIDEPQGDIKEREILVAESPIDRIFKEERTPSPYRKNMEIIKGLSDDLDKLPSLDICSKRFSFLSDSSTIEENKKEEDPFSIITGIPPKISLIDRVEPKRTEKDTQSPSREFLAPWKPPNILPSLNNSIYSKKEEPKEPVPYEPTWKKVAILREDFRAPSPFKANTDDFWKKDLWNNENSKPVNRNETVSPISSFLKDDPEPAWKKELRDIALQKAESRDDDVEYKVIEEPPWRRELRELAQARGAKVLPIKEINLEEVIEPPWKQRPWSMQEKPRPSPPPTWSQTLRPKSWKERNADLSTPKPVTVPEWKRAMSPKINVTDDNRVKSPMERLNTLATEVRKTPEITVEVVNQSPYKPPVVPNNSNNGYVYPWESSSDSSAAFSPEPRTPTPQSRNSPFTGPQNPYQFSTLPKEYGTLSFQPRSPMLRTCPIQSRSFKYLQLLTGTQDDYEDDEPFIPQPPQHARPL